MTEKTSLIPVVELKSLSKGFDGKQIISRLDLTINHGEFFNHPWSFGLW
ncbi:putrescine/spermidine ABC transporter ATPase protein [Proteus penneri ATCC 35198]|nr:putrescine/spermidine ABC transporter ATPase protein [Proteus penneri ATCC 35198]